MYEGTFSDNVPLISIALRRKKVVEIIDFVLDTGFSESLQITPEIADSLGLKRKSASLVEIADGQIITVPTSYLKVEMEGIKKSVQVMVSYGTPLAGIELFTQFGYTVIVDCKKREIFLKK